MKITIENGIELVIADSDKQYKCFFPGTIKEFIVYDNIIIVRIDGYETKINENVYGVDFQGNIKWQIQKLEFSYTGIGKYEKNNQQLYAYNWSGEHLIINPDTGKILEKGWSK